MESYVIPKLTEFLSSRGLTLSEAKTRIVHIDEGFNFLGFTIRRQGHKLLTKPQKEKVLKHLQSIKAYLRHHQQATTGQVIRDLNPIIRGWVNYYRHSVASRTFTNVRHHQWQMLWRWAKRRHPNKSSRWVHRRYFRNDSCWTFYEGNAELVKPDAMPITRFVKVRGKSSPYDPTLHAYWQERTKEAMARQTYSKRRLALLKNQEYHCTMCHILFTNTDEIDVHHDTPRRIGGTDDLQNLRAVHRWCHHQHHQRSGYKVLKA